MWSSFEGGLGHLGQHVVAHQQDGERVVLRGRQGARRQGVGEFLATDDEGHARHVGPAAARCRRRRPGRPVGRSGRRFRTVRRRCGWWVVLGEVGLNALTDRGPPQRRTTSSTPSAESACRVASGTRSWSVSTPGAWACRDRGRRPTRRRTRRHAQTERCRRHRDRSPRRRWRPSRSGHHRPVRFASTSCVATAAPANAAVSAAAMLRTTRAAHSRGILSETPLPPTKRLRATALPLEASTPTWCTGPRMQANHGHSGWCRPLPHPGPGGRAPACRPTTASPQSTSWSGGRPRRGTGHHPSGVQEGPGSVESSTMSWVGRGSR